MMDRILHELFGGGDDEQDALAAERTRPAATMTSSSTTAGTQQVAPEERHRSAQLEAQRKDFVDRYMTGNPSEGFTTEEALGHLRDMNEQMSSSQFHAAMGRTLEHLPAEQQDQFIAMMRQHRANRPSAADHEGSDAHGEDALGDLTTELMRAGVGARGLGISNLLRDLDKHGLLVIPARPNEPPREPNYLASLYSPVGRAVLGGLAAYGLQAMQTTDANKNSASGTGSRC
jgi:hypothetical protein